MLIGTTTPITTATPRPTPLPTAKALSPTAASAALGIPVRTIQRQLREAPQDRRGVVTKGPWEDCYRRGAHWRVPVTVIQRLSGARLRERDAAMAAALDRLAQVEAEMARVQRAIVAAMAAWQRAMEQ